VKTATQKKRAARFQSAAEFRVAVDKLAALTYPDKTFNPKLIIGGGVAAALLVGIIAMVSHRSSSDSDSPAIAPIENISYEKAATMLRIENLASDGFAMLKQLAEQDDAQALFLLSRLYFKSGEESDITNTTDSLEEVRQWLGINIDNARAHSLLVKAVNLNQSDYHAEYELGCDYKSNLRGTTRQTDSAYIYLSDALKKANINNDREYIDKITDKMSNLQKP
jgi:serine/threonine-protein kinase